MATPRSARYRYTSVDAMRGLVVAAMLVVNAPGDWRHVFALLAHSTWNGCTIADTIFPVFLFLVGVSISLSLAGDVSNATSGIRVAARAGRLFVAGLALNALTMWAMRLPHFFVMGTLQRIAVCYAAAALIAMHLSPRAQWIGLAALIAGHAALLSWGGSYAPFENISDRLDDTLLGAHAWIQDVGSGRHRDPDGVLSTLGALATTLWGVRVGDDFRHGRQGRLWAMAALAIALAWMWSSAVPVNKKLWTGPFVLGSGGAAIIMLMACHYVFDQRGWPPLGQTLGINAISAFLLSQAIFIVCYAYGWWQRFYFFAFGDVLIPHVGPYVASLIFALSFALVMWLLLAALGRLGYRIRI